MPLHQLTPDSIEILLNEAPVADSPDCFRLLPIIGNLHFGRLASGEVCLLLVLEGRPRPITVEYGGLRLQLFENAEVCVGVNRQDAALGVLVCLNGQTLHNFCIIAADICEILRSESGGFRTHQQFREYVVRWAEVFSPGQLLSSETELGLWGEVEVLASLPEPESALAAWHGPEAATFDFGGNGIYVEVKTSTVGHRHHFGLEQVSPPTAASALFIASLSVIEDPASGRSLDQQVALLRARLSTTLPLDRKLAGLLFQRGSHTKKYSLLEINYFRGEDVPRPRAIDEGVTGVRFIADLTRRKAASVTSISEALSRLSR